MLEHWTEIIEPVLNGVKPTRIIEIGSETGRTTRKLLEFSVEQVVSIDPFPKYDKEGWVSQFGDKFHCICALSLNALPSCPYAEVVLIDGDHNWYTVFNELKLILSKAEGRDFPVTLFHDVGWPYARRDLYYDISTIPEEFRQPHAVGGLTPGVDEVTPARGVNQLYCHACSEGGPRNGVLTAVEDFIAATPERFFEFVLVPAFQGLGILWERDSKLATPEFLEIISEIRSSQRIVNLLDTCEQTRVAGYAKFKTVETYASRLKQQRDVLNSNLIEAQNRIKAAEAQYSLLESRNFELREELSLSNLPVQHQVEDSRKIEMRRVGTRLQEVDRELEALLKLLSSMTGSKRFKLARAIILSLKGLLGTEARRHPWVVEELPSLFAEQERCRKALKRLTHSCDEFSADIEAVPPGSSNKDSIRTFEALGDDSRRLEGEFASVIERALELIDEVFSSGSFRLGEFLAAPLDLIRFRSFNRICAVRLQRDEIIRRLYLLDRLGARVITGRVQRRKEPVRRAGVSPSPSKQGLKKLFWKFRSGLRGRLRRVYHALRDICKGPRGEARREPERTKSLRDSVIVQFSAPRSRNPYYWLTAEELQAQGYDFRFSTNFQEIRKIVSQKKSAIVHFHQLDAIYKNPRFFGSSVYDSAVRLIEEISGLKQLGARIIWTSHNPAPHDGQDSDIDRFATDMMGNLADLTTVLGEHPRAELSDKIAPSKLKVVYHPTLRSLYESQMLPQAACRERYNLPTDALIFGSFGEMKRYKGIEQIVKAYHEFRLTSPDTKTHLVIAGRPSDPSYVDELCVLTAEAEDITLIPSEISEADVPILVRSFDWSVFYFRNIWMSTSVALSLSLEVPVIVPAKGCLPEIVKRTGSGIIFDDDLDDLAEALQQAADRRKLQHARYLTGEFSSVFSLRSAVELQKACYEEALQQ